MKRVLVLCCFLLSSWFGFALAGGPEEEQPLPVMFNQHQGFYLGGNLGGAYVVGTNETGNTDTSFWGFALTGLVGYQLNPNFGVEGGVLYSPNIFNGLFSLSESLTDYYLAVKGIWPIGERFDIFGKIGPSMFSAQACVNISGVKTSCGTNYFAAPYLSAGFGYALTEALELTVETGGIIPINQNTGFIGNVLAGLIYHF